MELGENSQSVYFSDGAIGQLEGILQQVSSQRVFFVVDEAAYSASGAASQLEACFRTRQASWFSRFESNPKFEDVNRGIEAFRNFAPDVAVALGGGTAIDVAKLVNSLALATTQIRDVIIGNCPVPARAVPLVAIPTTAGTGSEATHFAVVYLDGRKFSVAHRSMLPRYAIIDHELTASMPPLVTATTGLDALCQAIESMWAVGASDESIGYASRALRLAMMHLETAVRAPNPAVRSAMCEAAHLAGKAINISKTTAPHAISYSITTHFGIPHGAAVALTIGPLLEYNAGVSDADCNDPRGPEEVRRRMAQVLSVLETDSAAAARQKLETLFASIGCPASLPEVGIMSDPAIRQLVERADVDRLTNNPRKLNARRLFELLRNSSVNTVGGRT